MKHRNQRSCDDFCDYPLREVISQYYFWHVTCGHSAETMRFYKFHLGIFEDWCYENGLKDFEEIEVFDLRTFFAQYMEDHTRNGAAIEYRAVKAFFRWAWDEYEFERKNPIKKITITADPVHPIEGVNPDDVPKLFESAKQGNNPERDCAVLAVLLDTGIRKSSFLQIRKCDVDPIAGSIFIRHMKARNQITVYLGKKARRYLRKYYKSITIANDDLFWRTENGDPLSDNGFREILRRIASRAGIPEYSAHDFRRYFALQTYRNGADIYAVAEMLGQSGVEVTRRYLAISDNDRKMIHAKTSPLDNRSV